MNEQELLKKYPELEEIISLIKYEMQLHKRPANEVIMDDPDLQILMHVSKRKTQQWRDENIITYYKPSGKIFYLLSDVLEMLKKAKIPAGESEIMNLLEEIKKQRKLK